MYMQKKKTYLASETIIINQFLKTHSNVIVIFQKDK